MQLNGLIDLQSYRKKKQKPINKQQMKIKTKTRGAFVFTFLRALQTINASAIT